MLPTLDFGAAQPVLDLGVSYSDSCVRLPSGIKCWGWNQMGQLGRSDTLDRGGKAGQMGDALGFADIGG